MKKYYLAKNLEEVIARLTGEFGVPAIDTNLSVYARSKLVVAEITIVNNLCYVRIYNDYNAKDDDMYKYFKSTEPLLIENRNIKYIFKTIHNLGVKDAIISRIVKLSFVKNEVKVQLEIGTILGDLLSISGANFKDLGIEEYGVESFSATDIERLIAEKNIPTAPIFDRLGNINTLIKRHADIYGINLSLNEQTIRSAAMYKSNDFTELESAFKLSNNVSITDTIPLDYHPGQLKPLSIIIPCYNSSESIVKTLASVESQDLRIEDKKDIEVIIVDDGSNERVADIVDSTQYSFPIHIIRFEKNLGLSHARNVGASLAKNGLLLFIDSDILLSKNYIYEHNIRLQSLPDSVLLSLKQNVHSGDPLTHFMAINKGLDIPENFNDKRLFREQKKNTPWVNEITSDGMHEILSETNYFTSFGNGRIINGFDLPSAVVGHNMSMRKSVFKRTGGFSTRFNGWGLEDTLFGACAIAHGCFVIPVLACGVYHIDHPVRQETEELKIQRYKENIEEYKRILEEKI